MTEQLRPIEYPGFMNMVNSLFGGGMNPAPLANRQLASVTVENDGELLVFTMKDGERVVYRAEGDCCSRSWIEHITVPPDIEGSVIDAWSEQTMGEKDDGWETIKVYQTSFRTDRGEIVVEYRNSSNGYYGGWLEGPV